MLILQRRVGERVVVSGGIEITVTAVTKRGVKLAVSAPPGVSVLRGEVHDAIVQANAQAASDAGATSGAGPVIRLKGTRFGEIEIDEKRAISFPRGLIGFADARRYALLEPREGSAVAWLQSLDLPELAFPVMDGAQFGPQYPEPGASDLAREAGLGPGELAGWWSWRRATGPTSWPTCWPPSSSTSEPESGRRSCSPRVAFRRRRRSLSATPVTRPESRAHGKGIAKVAVLRGHGIRAATQRVGSGA
jgi:carbon storage regulator CsrA